MMASGIFRPGIQDGDSATLQDLTVSGLLTANHIHGGIAGNLYIHVRNDSGGELVAGTAVYAIDTVGDTDRVRVSSCDPTNPAKMPAVGLLETTLANNGDGNAVVVGELRPFNTAGFTIGDQLYVGANGAPTATVPTSGEVQSIGSVVRVNSETGTVLVQISAALAKVAVSGAYADLSGTPTVPAPADATPQPLGVAAIGASADYAREDHVHAMPSAANVGADPAGTAASAVSAHVAAADPHPGYALESELGDAAGLDVGTTSNTVAAGDDARITAVEIGLACSDETSALTTGAGKVTFRMPYAMTLTAVRASVTTAPTGSTLVVDINEGGTSILSTKLSIDAGEKTSTTAAVPAVISDSSLADDAEVTIDIDQIGATVAGAGLKVWLIGRRA